MSSVLQRLEKLTMTNPACVTGMNGTANGVFVGGNKLCTFPQANQGVCAGDLGSKMIFHLKKIVC
jgi:hypothetical protein